jgi:hypothetical protein
MVQFLKGILIVLSGGDILYQGDDGNGNLVRLRQGSDQQRRRRSILGGDDTYTSADASITVGHGSARILGAVLGVDHPELRHSQVQSDGRTLSENDVHTMLA